MLLKKEDIERISVNIAKNIKQTVIEQLQDIELQDIVNDFNEKLNLIPHITNTTGYHKFPDTFKDSDGFSIRVPIHTHTLSGRITQETIQYLGGNYTKIAKNLVEKICSKLVEDLHNQLKNKTNLVLRKGLVLQRFNDPDTSEVVLQIYLRYRVIPDVLHIKSEKQLTKELNKLNVSPKFLKSKAEPIRV